MPRDMKQKMSKPYNEMYEEMLDVDFQNGEYTQKDRITGKKSFNKLG